MVEKCTRLHIHYAHRLCEEPMSCFDAKISFENMTKCLQILKERYQDLDNQDIYCNNEVEFRDYSVLLSLSKGYSQVLFCAQRKSCSHWGITDSRTAHPSGLRPDKQVPLPFPCTKSICSTHLCPRKL
ncbi:unnamed protein product, partial [Eretmochelys imbricata]